MKEKRKLNLLAHHEKIKGRKIPKKNRKEKRILRSKGSESNSKQDKINWLARLIQIMFGVVLKKLIDEYWKSH